MWRTAVAQAGAGAASSPQPPQQAPPAAPAAAPPAETPPSDSSKWFALFFLSMAIYNLSIGNISSALGVLILAIVAGLPD